MTIYIPTTIYSMIQGFVLGCEYEISWIGKVAKFKDGFIIEDIKLIKQEVSATSTLMDLQGTTTWLEIFLEEGTTENWKLWGHSHAKMGVFWSNKDIVEIMDHDNKTKNNNWLLSLEFNHEMEWIGRIDIFYPVHTTVAIGSLQIISEQDDQIIAYCQEEIRNKVTVKNPVEKIDKNNKVQVLDDDELSKSIHEIMNRQNNLEKIPQSLLPDV